MSVKYKFKIVGDPSVVRKAEWFYSSNEPDSDDYMRNDGDGADDCGGGGGVL